MRWWLIFLIFQIGGCTQPKESPPVTVNVGTSSGTGTGTQTGMPFYQWLDLMNLTLSMTRNAPTSTATGSFTCFIANAQFPGDGGTLVTLLGTGPTPDDAMKNYVVLIAGKHMTHKDPNTGATNVYTVPFNLTP